MKLVGYGLNPFAFGFFDCDQQKLLPSIYAEDYIEQLLQACTNDGIDIFIPSLDDELLLIAENKPRFDRIGVHIPISGRKMIELCRNKELMSRELNKHAAAFVTSHTKEGLLQALQKNEIVFPLIAKPVSGFASRGLLIIHGPDDINKLTQDHVIQEIAAPQQTDPHYQEFITALGNNVVSQVAEISLQILVGKDGQELGRHASYVKLQHGVPVEIIPTDIPAAWEAIDKLLPVFLENGLYGPLNIQGRMTDKGPRFVEMNARFTGLSGLRAITGFNEVEAIIADAAGLLHTGFRLQQNFRKIGMRQVKDRVVDIETNADLKTAVQATAVYPSAKQGRAVLVTGANGYLGRAVLDALLVAPGIHRIIALVRNPDRFDGINEPRLPEGIDVLDIAELETGNFQLGAIDVICHLASARPFHQNQDIAESLQFTQKIVGATIKHQIPGFINASSQAIYGTTRAPAWSEETPPAPETPYGHAKWASELMTASINALAPASRAISLRLAQLIGPSLLSRPNELAHKYIAASLQGEVLKVLGGHQRLDLIDVRDAAKLIAKLVVAPYSQWPGSLNVSTGKSISVLELAQQAISATANTSTILSPIDVVENITAPSFGMNNIRASELFGWAPDYTLGETLASIVKEFDFRLRHKADKASSAANSIWPPMDKISVTP